MLKVRSLLFVLLLLCCASSVFAVRTDGKWILSMPKNTPVVLKVPRSLYIEQEYLTRGGRHQFHINVTEDAAGEPMINGDANWLGASWYSRTNYEVREVQFKNEKDFTGTEINLISPGWSTRLRFPSTTKNIDKLFARLVFQGNIEAFEKTDYYKNEVCARLFPKYFPGPMAQFSEETKFKLLKAADFYRVEEKLGMKEYKGKKYMFAGDNTGDWRYNSRRYSKPQRVVVVTNEKLLAYLKSMYEVIKDHKDFDGVKLEYGIKHKDLVTDDKYGMDALEIYAPLDALKAFSEDEIISQEFLDKCVILVDGNRTKIDLALAV